MQLRVAIALFFALGTTSAVQANNDAEREVLARIVYELDRLEALITEAEAEADPDNRIHFRYDWLRQDLEQVSEGIEAHIEAAHSLPRPVSPLRGDYRH